MTLSHELLQHACMALNQNGLSPAAHFAKKGNDARVHQLISMLHGKPKDAAYGYALAGEFEKANALLTEKSSETEQEAIKKSMVRGAARANQLEALKAFIPNRADYADAEVCGLAERGELEALGNLVNLNLDLYQDAIQGFARTAQTEALLDHLKMGSFHLYAIFQAAEAGHKDLVHELLASSNVASESTTKTIFSEGDTIAYKALLNHAVKGYAKGCHFNEAIAILDKGASIMQCSSELPASISIEDIKAATEPVTFDMLDGFIAEYAASAAHRSYPDSV